tara:strand:- start:159 stop:344 length:186 start_codon:yes stop_codon:yes gene_type:complete
MAKSKKKKKRNRDLLLAAHSKIVPFMKTHIKNPHTGEDPIRTRTYLHPNERFKRFGTWDKI